MDETNAQITPISFSFYNKIEVNDTPYAFIDALDLVIKIFKQRLIELPKIKNVEERYSAQCDDVTLFYKFLWQIDKIHQYGYPNAGFYLDILNLYREMHLERIKTGAMLPAEIKIKITRFFNLGENFEANFQLKIRGYANKLVSECFELLRTTEKVILWNEISEPAAQIMKAPYRERLQVQDLTKVHQRESMEYTISSTSSYTVDIKDAPNVWIKLTGCFHVNLPEGIYVIVIEAVKHIEKLTKEDNSGLYVSSTETYTEIKEEIQTKKRSCWIPKGESSRLPPETSELIKIGETIIYPTEILDGFDKFYYFSLLSNEAKRRECRANHV